MQVQGYREPMLGRTYDDQNCSAARALELVGERWSLLIIRDALFAGFTRFTDFQRDLGLAPNVLAARLEAFVAAGLMETRSYSARPDHHEYLLTEKGRDLLPVVVALTKWGDRWAAPNGPPIVYEHAQCGAVIDLPIRCPQCGDIDTAAVVAVVGPGFESRGHAVRAGQ
jgi:DNA-binding HxlR family transcriptional regulator